MGQFETSLVRGLLSLAEGLATERSLEPRLTELCRVTTSLLGCDRSSLFFLEGGYYRAAFNHGNPPDVAARFPAHRVSPRDPLVSLAMRTRRHVIVNDVQSSTLVNEETARGARIRAMVLAPLLEPSGEALGFLTAEYNENPGHFTETQSTLVLGLAKLAQLAVTSERRQAAREQAETERTELRERLSEAQRLESLGRLAGGLAHDFNNLITVILGHGAFLKMHLTDPEFLAELAQIDAAAERAGALTRQLLALGRRQVLQPRVIRLDQIVFGLEPMLRRAVSSNVAIAVEPAPDLGFVRADPVQMEQVLVNLVLNARDAMPSGGRITLALENVELEPEDCRTRRNATPGSYVVLSVKDTGEGMDEETQRRVFEPFFTTKGTGLGSGLGLSSVLGVVEQTGGHIVLESEPGRGTSFRVHFPRVEGSPENGAAQVRNASREGNGTVLVVDDDRGVSAVARRILESHGHRVLEASTGEQALAASAGHAGPIHALVTDVVMPDMTGRELAERLRVTRPDLRVLFVSGHAENSIVHGGFLDPDVAFLAKPFTPQELARRVRDVLRTEPTDVGPSSGS